MQNTWTLWFYENDRNNTWEENQKEIASFATVEDFWRYTPLHAIQFIFMICNLNFSLFNHIKLASELRQGSDYSLFKRGIRPMWEDEANKRGGRWLINLEKKQRLSGDLDKFWLDVVCFILITFIIVVAYL